MRSLRHLLFAGGKIKNSDYDNKFKEIVESFINNGMDKKYAWDDYHAVAFRTMVLVDAWWKLRERNALSLDLSNKILETLKVHGDFMLDRKHYESGRNHGLNEIASLLLLSTSFPDIEGAKDWHAAATKRLEESAAILIDDDGSLVENSSYYHFYVLEKYWEIYDYMQRYYIPAGDFFKERLNKMILYSTFILQPNLDVPLLGASIEKKNKISG
ncbi:MAG: heparinase II/III family protein [bacterium]